MKFAPCVCVHDTMEHLIYFTHFTRKREEKKREGSWESWKTGRGRKMVKGEREGGKWRRGEGKAGGE